MVQNVVGFAILRRRSLELQNRLTLLTPIKTIIAVEYQGYVCRYVIYDCTCTHIFHSFYYNIRICMYLYEGTNLYSSKRSMNLFKVHILIDLFALLTCTIDEAIYVNW